MKKEIEAIVEDLQDNRITVATEDDVKTVEQEFNIVTESESQTQE